MTSTCGTPTSARPASVSTSIGRGPRDRATTGGPSSGPDQHVAGREPRAPAQVGGNAEDSGDQGDVDEGQQLLKARLPRSAVEQHGHAGSPGRFGQREREDQVVAVDEDRVSAVHERRRPVRCVGAPVGRGGPALGRVDRDDRALPAAARHQHSGDGRLIQRTRAINHVDPVRGQVGADQGAQG